MSACCQERENAITMKGDPLTLVGSKLNVGDKAPDFTLVKNDLSEASLDDFTGKTLILSIVPSLDTGVCDKQTRRFNEEAGKLEKITILTISMDLPFAQARWCGAAGVEDVITLSAHRDESFGKDYGLLIKELRLLGRAVLVVDSGGTIRYQHIVKELTELPDYDAAIQAAKEA